MPKGAFIARAIGPAQDIADGFDKAADGPQTHKRAKPQKRPRAGKQHLARGAFDQISDTRRQGCGQRPDERQLFLRLAQKLGDSRHHDEKGKDGQQRQIGKVTRMDEAIAIHAHDNAADDFKGRRSGADQPRQTGRGRMRPRVLAPRLWRFGRIWPHGP